MRKWHYIYVDSVSLKSIQYVFNYGKNNEKNSRVTKTQKSKPDLIGSLSFFLASGPDGQSAGNILVLLIYSECF